MDTEKQLFLVLIERLGIAAEKAYIMPYQSLEMIRNCDKLLSCINEIDLNAYQNLRNAVTNHICIIIKSSNYQWENDISNILVTTSPENEEISVCIDKLIPEIEMTITKAQLIDKIITLIHEYSRMPLFEIGQAFKRLRSFDRLLEAVHRARSESRGLSIIVDEIVRC